jgi:hypothetical protein
MIPVRRLVSCGEHATLRTSAAARTLQTSHLKSNAGLDQIRIQ